ncbi:hypothetical protein KC366_g92 [Hortaea werneckii]|nr:hypothetical protein KC366_g92 [Hortaea werneckii]
MIALSQKMFIATYCKQSASCCNEIPQHNKMELSDVLLSLINILAMGAAIGLSILAAVLFILSLWKLGCILGQPAFVAIFNSSPFRDTYTDSKDEKASSGTQDTSSTKHQQRPRLSASERKAKDARNFAGTVALFLYPSRARWGGVWRG